MTEIIEGSDSEKQALAEQLRRLHEFDFVVVIGSLGRAALYETFGYPDAPKWPTRQRLAFNPYPLVERDIDVVMPFDRGDRDAVVASVYGEPHPIDDYFNTLFDHPGGYQVGDMWSEMRGLDPRVLETRTRRLGGVPVRTFTLGTQYMMEQMIRGPHTSSKYTVSFDRFTDFVRWAAARHPDEFLPAEFYEPFLATSSPAVLPPVPLPPPESCPPPQPMPVRPREQADARYGRSDDEDLPFFGWGASTGGEGQAEAGSSVEEVGLQLRGEWQAVPTGDIDEVLARVQARIAELEASLGGPGGGEAEMKIAHLLEAQQALEEVQRLLLYDVRINIEHYLAGLGIDWPIE